LVIAWTSFPGELTGLAISFERRISKDESPTVNVR
jgi:hypothetical protein